MAVEGAEEAACKYRYQTEIQAMLFTFGNCRIALPETTRLIEEIIRAQMLQLVFRFKFKLLFFMLSKKKLHFRQKRQWPLHSAADRAI